MYSILIIVTIIIKFWNFILNLVIAVINNIIIIYIIIIYVLAIMIYKIISFV